MKIPGPRGVAPPAPTTRSLAWLARATRVVRACAALLLLDWAVLSAGSQTPSAPPTSSSTSPRAEQSTPTAESRRASRESTFERPIHTTGTGPQKLTIDLPLLTGAQPFERVLSAADGSRALGGLTDLRLLDASGREVGYLLITSPRPQADWISSRLLPIAQTEKTSGFEIDLGQPRSIDALAVDGLPVPFLKRFVLEASGDRSRWTMLIDEGTLFDLPDERVRHTVVAFPPGAYRYFRVTWDDTNSGRMPLPRVVRAREATVRPVAAPLRAPVTVERQASEPGRSRYRIRLPAAELPIVAVLLDVGAGDVFRTASVTETRFSGVRADPVELGRARLVRAGTRTGSDAGLRIELEQPRGSELQLVIEDGNNPALQLRGVAIEFAGLPWIYFEAAPGPVTARYGGRNLTAPQYDLEARRGTIDLSRVPEASWGEPRATAAPPSTPPASPALPDRGAPLSVSDFSYRRTLPESGGGLVALQLDAAVLSHSRGPSAGFADVRVVDDQGKQIPYLMERRDEPLSLDLPMRPATPKVRELAEGGQTSRSIYAVPLPYPNLPGARLVLETSDRVFRRSLRIGVERPPDRQRRDLWFEVLATPSWQHANQGTVAPPLEVAITAGDASELLLIVDEGDNRPLAISAARLLLPSWRLRFFMPADPLRLVYGKRDAAAPEYDLALLAPAVMSGEVTEIVAGPEGPSASSTRAVLLAPRVFWIGIGVAAVVLLGLIVRLIAAGAAPPPSPPAP